MHTIHNNENRFFLTQEGVLYIIRYGSECLQFNIFSNFFYPSLPSISSIYDIISIWHLFKCFFESFKNREYYSSL